MTGLYRNISSSWMIPSHCFPLFRVDDWMTSLFISWYVFCISHIYSLTCTFPFSLQLSNSSTSNLWMWCVCLFISPWITVCSLSAILYMSPSICSLYVSLAYSNIVSISANSMFATFTNLTRFWTCNCISVTLSNSQIIW